MNAAHMLSQISIAAILFSSVSIASADKLQEFQQLCDSHGTAPVSVNIPCMEALLNASHDPVYAMGDPATQLFILDAEKLLTAVDKKRLSESAGKEKFLHLLLGLQDRHRPDLQASQTATAIQLNRQENDQAAAARTAEDLARQEKREAAAAMRNAQVEQQRQNERQADQDLQRQEAAASRAAANQQSRAEAVRFCIVEANERSPYAFSASANCTANPNYYQTVLRIQKAVVTNCQRLGSVDQVTCRSQ